MKTQIFIILISHTLNFMPFFSEVVFVSPPNNSMVKCIIYVDINNEMTQHINNRTFSLGIAMEIV
jgi:hypothetical protein